MGDVLELTPKAPLKLRCSALPLAFKCPGSARAPRVAIDHDSAAARLGTAVHEAMQRVVEFGAIDWDGLPAVAQKHQVEDEGELRMIVSLGKQLWDSPIDDSGTLLRNCFPEAATEVPLSWDAAADGYGYTLSGTLDVLSESGHEHELALRCADHKSGRADLDYSAQLKGYALLMWRQAGAQTTSVTATGLWLLDKTIENHTVSRADAEQFAQDIQDRVVDWDGTFRPGRHCAFCRRGHECEARDASERQLLRVFGAVPGPDLIRRLESLPDADLLTLDEQASTVGAMAAALHDSIRWLATERGPIDDGKRRLEVIEQRQESLDPLKTWPVLTAAGFGDAEFARCTKLSKSEVKDIVARRAGRGKGAQAIRDLEKDLRKADALVPEIKLKLHRTRSTTVSKQQLQEPNDY